jgi:O-antigen/teichoic acid export membrane protein
VLRFPKGRHRRVRRRRRWVSKGLWAIMDQGLFALTNFIVNVLLARWLSQSDYGAFAVAFSVLLLMGTVHTALLTEPMLVLGPSRFKARTVAYIRRLVPIHFAVSSGMGVIILLGVLSLTLLSPIFAASTLAALAVSAPAILFLWLMRRACYIESRPHLAATGGLMYSLLVLAGMLVLVRVGPLSAATALAILGLASFLVAWWLWRRLRQTNDDSSVPISYADLVTVHWRYGKWALGSGLLGWVPGNIVVLALPLWHSLNAAATLRAALILIMPMLQVIAALTILLVPALVQAHTSGKLRSVSTTAMIIFVGFGVAYGPLVIMFGSQLADWIFEDQYQFDRLTLWLLAAIPPLTATLAVSSSTLRALERPDWIMWANVAATAVTCVIGLLLVFWWAVDGALVSILLSLVTTVALASWASHRLVRKDSANRMAPHVERAYS